MTQKVQVELGERAYPIFIGEGILIDELNKLEILNEVALVTDGHVTALDWFPQVEEALRAKAKKYVRCAVQAGEESKNLAVYTSLCSKLARNNLSRDCTIVALGGGVIGDLAGFLASTYLRGVKLVQVPTTLMAAVDSSVGGKTAVNLPEGKNLVGAFYQPERVIMDVNTLQTLSKREYANGMAEVIKYGLIRDKNLWEELASSHLRSLPKIIARCVQIKAFVVGEDERDMTGERAILNFGHTIGHAIEQTMGYGKWLHGEAVAVGMLAATRLSEKVFGLPSSVTQELKRVLAEQSLPVHAPELDEKRILEAVAHDKKSTAQSLHWVLLREIGKAESNDEVTEEMLKEVIQACRQP
ncbi:MAG: 3-dehydroquinate synthase [Verrucomicrobiota bacterium]